MKDVQSIYTIYYNASDWPAEYVIKRWLVTDPEKAIQDPNNMVHDLSYLFNASSLELCREELKSKGLTNMGREREDDDVIVESWA